MAKDPIAPEIEKARPATFPAGQPAIRRLIETIDPLTRPSVSKPERKETETDAHSSRVIVVSPYKQFNDFFKYLIPEIVEGGYIDSVERYAESKPPYINVRKREGELHGPEPLFIIDFGKIMAPVVKKILDEARIAELRKSGFVSILREYLERVSAGEMEIPSEILEREEGYKDLFQRLGNLTYDQLKKLWEDSIELAHVPKEVIDTVPFNGYELWSQPRPIGYLRPEKGVTEELEKQQRYDESHNFLPNSVPATSYRRHIEADLRAYVRQRERDRIFPSMEFFEIRNLIP